MRNVPVQLLNADDSITETGPAIYCGQYVSGSFQIVCGDTSAAGAVKLQGSNDAAVGAQPGFVPTHWDDITGATSTVASGVGSPIYLTNINFQYIRAVYTSNSGGTTTIIVNASLLAV